MQREQSGAREGDKGREGGEGTEIKGGREGEGGKELTVMGALGEHHGRPVVLKTDRTPQQLVKLLRRGEEGQCMCVYVLSVAHCVHVSTYTSCTCITCMYMYVYIAAAHYLEHASKPLIYKARKPREAGSSSRWGHSLLPATRRPSPSP